MKWFAFLAAALASCVPAGPIETNPTTPCARAAEVVESLGCSEAWGIDEADGSFEALCLREAELGSGICPDEIASASTCEEIDAIASHCDE